MKQLLTAILFTALCSCGSVKKVSSKNETKTDSTGQKSSFLIEAKKKDSTGTDTTKEITKRESDSSYSKKTVIKEIFDDAFDFDGSAVTSKVFAVKYDTSKLISCKPVTRDQGNLFYRETTILESGNIAKAEQTEKQAEQKSTVQAVDTSARGANVQGTVSNVNRSQDDQKSKPGTGIGLKWFLIGVFFLVLLIIVCYKIIH